MVTDEMGGGVVFVRDSVVTGSLPAGPVQPGGVAVGDYAAAADVQGNGIWIYSGPKQELVGQGPLGTTLTQRRRSAPTSPRIVTDLPSVRRANSVAVDPRSGNILVTGSDPGSESSLQIIPAGSVDVP
ncbi:MULTISPECIES: hypothetical protein [Nocardiaceae]|uniref:Uncharacterized protein n=1 Tax=Rhodococcoides kroppenstedtii TaxID=293050 RepID=A0ABS7NUY8_9NOCA|nr:MULTISPECIES: hypothetical protein [Rhodococcus]MBY6313910.1 hypothetical protein [Rhodococcus kroppenstedtii]MBY6321413.1 hypothetical protein [Rhodococcus kroppenstedtii]MBY6400112.1 hypothetical protein [Rhodococcus kroppenstedtii]